MTLKKNVPASDTELLHLSIWKLLGILCYRVLYLDCLLPTHFWVSAISIFSFLGILLMAEGYFITGHRPKQSISPQWLFASGSCTPSSPYAYTCSGAASEGMLLPTSSCMNQAFICSPDYRWVNSLPYQQRWGKWLCWCLGTPCQLLTRDANSPLFCFWPWISVPAKYAMGTGVKCCCHL